MATQFGNPVWQPRSQALEEWELRSKMEDESEGRKLVVLYGSQTGTAEEVAERIGREARRRFIVPNVLAMDDYNIVCSLY